MEYFQFQSYQTYSWKHLQIFHPLSSFPSFQEAKVTHILTCLNKTHPPVLIFAEKKQDVDLIQEYLLLKGVTAAAIHGGKDQEERSAAVQAFQVRAQLLLSWVVVLCVVILSYVCLLLLFWCSLGLRVYVWLWSNICEWDELSSICSWWKCYRKFKYCFFCIITPP